MGDVVVIVDIFAFTLYVESFLDDPNSWRWNYRATLTALHC